MFIPNLDQTYFELFEFEEHFVLDESLLDRRFRELQKDFHPDRFARGTDREKRASVQFSSFLNQAYKTLKNALSRALYLLELKGVNPETFARENADVDFLMRQIEMREELEAIAKDQDAVDKLEDFTDHVAAQCHDTVARLREHFSAQDWQVAATETVKLQFLVKLRTEAEALLAELDY